MRLRGNGKNIRGGIMGKTIDKRVMQRRKELLAMGVEVSDLGRILELELLWSIAIARGSAGNGMRFHEVRSKAR